MLKQSAQKPVAATPTHLSNEIIDSRRGHRTLTKSAPSFKVAYAGEVRTSWKANTIPGFLKSRISALQKRVWKLNDTIKAELKRPLPCSLHLSKLKRERLFLRDEINRLKRA